MLVLGSRSTGASRRDQGQRSLRVSLESPILAERLSYTRLSRYTRSDAWTRRQSSGGGRGRYRLPPHGRGRIWNHGGAPFWWERGVGPPGQCVGHWLCIG